MLDLLKINPRKCIPPFLGSFKALTAIAILVGATIGAGVLGIPFVFAKAGFLAGMINLILIGGAATLMTLYVGELTLRTKNKHQLAGFAGKYLGIGWKYVMLLLETFAIYTVLIAYLIGIGIAFSNLFPGSPVIWATIFFLVTSPLIYVGIKTLCNIEFIVTSAKILIGLAIVIVLWPTTMVENFTTTLNFTTLFIPFGIVLFSTLGYTIIPEVEEVIKTEKHRLKSVILWAMAIVIIFYALFAWAFIGNFGSSVGEIAILSLTGKLAVWGNIFIILTMATSYIALGAVVKDVYSFDFNIDKRLAWFLAAFIPFMIFLYTDFSFISLLGIAGTYAFGVMGILTMWMIHNARKLKKPEQKPAYIVPGGNIPIYLLSAVFVGGILYQTALMLGVF